MITFDIYVLMGASAGEKKATVKCNDTGVNLRIFPETLTELSARRFKTDPYSIPSGSVAVLKVSKSDGTPLEIPAKRVEKNSVFFKLPPQTFTVEGVASAEVSIFGSDGRRVTSDTFYIDVSKECVADNVVDPVTQALAELSDGGGVEKPTTDDYLADLSNRQTELAGTLQKAGMEASPKEPYSTLVPKNAELVEDLLKVEGDVKQELAELSDGGGAEEPTIGDFVTDLTNRQTELAETLQDAGVKASPEEPYSTLVPKNAELVENLLKAEDDVKQALADLSNGGGVDNPTTDDYLNDLDNHRNSLAETLIESGVKASTDETFSTLVPKANEKLANSKDYLGARLTNTLSEYSNSEVTEIPEQAFRQCTSLIRANFPSVKLMKNSAFTGCSSLQEINAPLCETLGSGNEGMVFTDCISLIRADFPNVTLMTNFVFRGCTKLAEINFPKLNNVWQCDFQNCTSLTEVELPSAFCVSANAFNGCKSLVTLRLPLSTGVTIKSNAFNGCSSLEHVYITAITNKENLSFSSSPKLTLASAKNIIEALPDYSGTDDEYKYQCAFSNETKALLEAEGATSPNGNTWLDYIDDKGWNI